MKPATPQEMRRISLESYFSLVMKGLAADPSKTKTTKSESGIEITKYYDDRGTELFSTHPIGAQGIAYTMTQGGNVSVFQDADGNGAIERMGYSIMTADGLMPYFEVESSNNNEKFDRGFPCTGPNAGEYVNINVKF